jgi:OOP family OmpA-OmpF porin
MDATEMPDAAAVRIDVTFAERSAELTSRGYAVLDSLARWVQDTPAARLALGVHTDATRSRSADLQLAQARAGVIRFYLQRQGVPAGRVTVQAFGSTQPIADNRAAAGRAANNRVVMRSTPD